MKNDIRQTVKESFAASTAKRCEHCQARMKRYRESPYMHYHWRCEGCGRTEELQPEPTRVLEFK